MDRTDTAEDRIASEFEKRQIATCGQAVDPEFAPPTTPAESSDDYKDRMFNSVVQYSECIRRIEQEYPPYEYDSDFTWLAQEKPLQEIIHADRRIMHRMLLEIIRQFRADILVQFVDELETSTVEIYCYNPFKIANDISNMLYKKFNIPTVNMRTIVEHEEIFIDYLHRGTFHLFNIVSGVNRVYTIHTVSNLLGKIPERLLESAAVCPAVDCADIVWYAYPPELQIIDMYSDPDIPFDEREEKIFTEVTNAYMYQIRNAVEQDPDSRKRKGGNESSSGVYQWPIPESQFYEDAVIWGGAYSAMSGKSCKEKKMDIIFQMKMTLVDKLIRGNKNIALFGKWADSIQRYGMKVPCVIPDRLQLVSPLGFAYVQYEIRQCIHKYFGRYEFDISSDHAMKIPKEYRMRSKMVKVRMPKEKSDFILWEYFNTLEYSALPCVVKVRDADVNGDRDTIGDNQADDTMEDTLAYAGTGDMVVYAADMEDSAEVKGSAAVDGMIDSASIDWIVLDRATILKYIFVELWSLFNIYSTEAISIRKYRGMSMDLISIAQSVRKSYPAYNAVIGTNLPVEEQKKSENLGVKFTQNYSPLLWEKKNGTLRRV